METNPQMTPEQYKAFVDAINDGKLRWNGTSWAVQTDVVEVASTVAEVVPVPVAAPPMPVSAPPTVVYNPGPVTRQTDGIIPTSFILSFAETVMSAGVDALTVDGVLPAPRNAGTVHPNFSPTAKRHSPDDLSEYVIDALMRVENALWTDWAEEDTNHPRYKIRWSVTATRYDSSSSVAGWNESVTAGEMVIRMSDHGYRHLRHWGTLSVDDALERCGYGKNFSNNQLRSAMRRAEERGWLVSAGKAGHANVWIIAETTPIN